MTHETKTNNNRPNVSSLLIRLWNHLSKRRHRQLTLLLVLMVVSALSEVISLGAVIPFIGALTAPDKVFSQKVVREFVEMVGITSPHQLVLPLAVVFAVAAMAAGALRLLLLWASTGLSNAIGADLSAEIYRRTLYQPYRIHLERNSSEVINGITNKSWNTVSVLQTLLTMVSSLLLMVALIITLLAIDPFVVSIAALVFGVGYGLVTWVSRRRLRINSEHIAKKSNQIIKALQEGLGGIRDVLLNGSQGVYCDIYRSADVPLRKANGSNVFIGASPRFIMEALGMVLIAGLAYIVSQQSGGIASGIPILGALALGSQRLLPALQLTYAAWVNVVGNQASLADTIDLLNQEISQEDLDPICEPLEFRNTIRFNAVRFRYIDNGPWVLNDLDLTIQKGNRVGFVGTTGSGKSTTLDLLMGLLEPTEGQILVDGESISGRRRRSWQKCIAHVPQSIFLADITLAENIAFGVPKKEIDMRRVKEAARQAQISEFIESGMRGYDELVGERGIRLSGGQCQRIGIARALYKNASVLVFDEATSSLDNATEQAVMESIESLNRDLTILIIAHRLTTVQKCDEIIELEHGRVVAQGSYEDLLERSPSFRSMALAVA